VASIFHFNYFPQNQLSKSSGCSLNNKGKQGQRNKFRNEGTNNLQAKKIKPLYAELSH